MYCRKKHRRRWRQRIEATRSKHKPRGQSISTPTVREWLFVTGPADVIGLKRCKCRSIRNRTRQTLTRED